MGMFDYLYYKGEQYQTKDTPNLKMCSYEIRGDELWFKKSNYQWEENETRFGGLLKETSSEWLFCSDYDGKIAFYRSVSGDSWEEYRALFNNGKLVKMEKIE